MNWINQPFALLLAVFLMGGVIHMTRGIPFWLFKRRRKELPQVVLYLSRVLPATIIALMIVYCLKNLSILAYPYGIPELLASLIVVILQIWKHQSVLSVIGGTTAYMIFIHFIF